MHTLHSSLLSQDRMTKMSVSEYLYVYVYVIIIAHGSQVISHQVWLLLLEVYRGRSASLQSYQGISKLCIGIKHAIMHNFLNEITHTHICS